MGDFMKISIRYKIIFAYSLICLLGFLCFSYFTSNMIHKRNKNIITRDVIEFKRNCNIYIKQYYLINKLNLEEKSFNSKGVEIKKYLENNMEKDIKIYDTKCNYISEDYTTYREIEVDKYRNIKDNGSLALLQQKKLGYDIIYYPDSVTVDFAFEAIINGQEIGIVRYFQDYTNLFEESNAIINTIKVVSIIIFALIFLLSVLVSRKIVDPIITFTNFAGEIENGNYSGKISLTTNDEIGELSRGLNSMAERIDTQIEKIEKDRDALKELNEHRKKFFDNVTHELKTPLTTIMGYGELVKDQGLEDRELFYEGMDSIILESNRLHKMVVELLELSYNSSGIIEDEFETVVISEIAKNVCRDMKLKGERYGIEIVEEFENGLKVEAIKEEIMQTIINLLDNAIKYGGQGGKIIVRAYKNKDVIKLEVEDFGQGIPEEKIHKIFQPFYRVDKLSSREVGGNGLGLSIVKEIVNKHNGKITIRSELGKGTTVIVEF